MVTGRPRKPPSRVANWITISEQILLSRQQQIAPRGGDREQITRARQAAEALFTSKPPPVSTRAVPESPTPPDRLTRKPRVLPILSPAAPVRHAERETPAPNDARDSAVAVRAHPHLGQVRHDRCQVATVYGVAADEIAPILHPGLTALRFSDTARAQGIGLRRNPQPEGRQSTRSAARQNEPHSSTQMS